MSPHHALEVASIRGRASVAAVASILGSASIPSGAASFGAMIRAALLGGGVLTALVVGPAAAFEGAGTRLPVEFRSWTIESPEGGEETLTQLHAPLTVTLDLAPVTRLVLATAGGRSALESAGASRADLGGLAGTELQIYQSLPRAGLLLFGGLRLPSAVDALDPDEIRVTQGIANPILGMHLRQYGNGLDLNLGVVWSRPLDARTRLSLGVAGRFSGAYEVEAGTAEFEPGPQLSATADLAWRNESWERHRRSLGLAASVRLFGRDEQGGDVVFEEGSEVSVEGRSLLPAAGAVWQLRLAAVLKGENTSFDRAGRVAIPRELAAGTGLWLESGLRWGERVSYGPELRVRSFAGNDVEYGDGFALELGPAVGLAVGAESSIEVRGAYLVGRMDANDGDADLRGFALGVGTSWRWF